MSSIDLKIKNRYILINLLSAKFYKAEHVTLLHLTSTFRIYIHSFNYFFLDTHTHTHTRHSCDWKL